MSFYVSKQQHDHHVISKHTLRFRLVDLASTCERTGEKDRKLGRVQTTCGESRRQSHVEVRGISRLEARFPAFLCFEYVVGTVFAGYLLWGSNPEKALSHAYWQDTRCRVPAAKTSIERRGTLCWSSCISAILPVHLTQSSAIASKLSRELRRLLRVLPV